MESFNVNIFEIKLRNFGIFDKLDLRFFPLQEFTTFLNTNKANNKLNYIIEAIKFIVDPYYLNCNNARRNLRENFDDGSVEITFVDTASEKTYYSAVRSFSKIKYIRWTSDLNGVEEIPIAQFQSRYFPATKCFSIEIQDTNNLLQSYFNEIWGAHETYLKCVESVDKKLPIDTENDICLNMIFVSRQYLAELEFRENFLSFFSICKIVNDIFQKFTNNLIGTVEFFVDLNDNFTSYQSISEENFNCNTKVITAIQFHEKKTCSVPIVWTNLSEYLKTILKLSAKIAVACHHSQKFLFLNSDDLKHLEFQQNLEAICYKIHSNNSTNYTWIKNNYLQNLVKLSKEHKLNLIIPFNNILKVSNAYLITINETTEEVETRLLNNETFDDLLLPAE